MGCSPAILKQNNRLSAITESSSVVSTGSCKRWLLRAPVSDTVSITIKPNLQNKSALATVIVGYAVLWLADLVFKIDFRSWIIALKLMSAEQFLIFLIYLVPFTAFFVVALHVLHRNLSTMGAGRGALYLTNILALTLGFIVLLGLQYGTLWLTGMLFNPLPDPSFVPLSTIVAIEVVPLLAIAAVVATFTWRRTGSSLPGAPICGIFVTWYVVAGTATQAAF
jgi:hypothetical protein